MPTFMFRLSGSIVADDSKDAYDKINALPIGDIDVEDGPDEEIEEEDDEDETE